MQYMSRGTKSIAFYLVMIVVFGSLMYFIAKEGESQQLESAITSAYDAPKDLGEGFTVFWELMTHHIQSPIGILLLQIITILLTCRLFGWLFQKIGQPTVIGEIVAGIVLGPSILGHLSPEVSGFLFPIESLANITILSQFGLILFMFAIGMELDITEVRKKLKETILISHTSTIVPFFCGMLTAYYVYDTYADKSTPFLSFALFVGIAMSITACVGTYHTGEGVDAYASGDDLTRQRGQRRHNGLVPAGGRDSHRTGGVDAECDLQHTLLGDLHRFHVLCRPAVPENGGTYLS